GVAVLILFFFFSSRRRHTRFSRDWSSDVCSSDLFRCSRSRFLHSRVLFVGGRDSNPHLPLLALGLFRLSYHPDQPYPIKRRNCSYRRAASKTASSARCSGIRCTRLRSSLDSSSAVASNNASSFLKSLNLSTS